MGAFVAPEMQKLGNAWHPQWRAASFETEGFPKQKKETIVGLSSHPKREGIPYVKLAPFGWLGDITSFQNTLSFLELPLQLGGVRTLLQ